MISRKSIRNIFILFTILLTVATLLPSDRIPGTQFKLYDKVIHFVLFGFWAGLLYLIEHFKNKRSSWFNYWYCVFITGTYGLLIEILQVTLPVNRSFELYDWVANVLGALFFSAVAAWISEKFLKDDSIFSNNDR